MALLWAAEETDSRFSACRLCKRNPPFLPTLPDLPFMFSLLYATAARTVYSDGRRGRHKDSGIKNQRTDS